MMDTATAARAVSGRLIGGNVRFARVTTDSRALRAGDLFVALRGERFDGHDFVPAALAHGAAAALVAADRAPALSGDLIAVADPLAALGRLAAFWRAKFTLPLAVVVGSNGKTTVKEMLAAILRAEFGDDRVLATEGNLNNAIGLPLTLLRLTEARRAAVIELGMNHRGETRDLAAIARPTIVVVNNAQREHQEFMASVAEVAAEHADAIAALPRGGLAVVNGDDAHASVWRAAAAAAGARVVAFGFAAGADVRADCTLRADGSDVVVATPAGAVRTTLAVPGRHMVANALAATAAALGAGASLGAVAAGLAGFRAVRGRLVALRATRGRRRAGRHVQREPRLDARRDRRARGGTRRALARDGRHGRGGRVGSRVPSRDRRVRARAGHRAPLRARRAGARIRGGVRGGRRALRVGGCAGGATSRATRSPASPCWSRARGSCGWSASSTR